MNPYQSLPDFCFWSRAVSWPAPGLVDPCTSDYTISVDQKIATLGSCFAQHLARHIAANGLNYYIAETAPSGMSTSEASARNYGTFSARYGNVYTVRQAVQLFDRAFGAFLPMDQVWEKAEGVIDSFRPQIDPCPMGSPEEVEAARARHLTCVREVFLNADWIVFTLGLTEAWCSRLDGAIYPIAPGVSGGTFEDEKYSFINFTAGDVTKDLCGFVERVFDINPNCKFILTVSPVPLIATFEKRHVWTSTTFSKAALRVACDETERLYPGRVMYFPSYEIITSPAAGSRYYADDLRQVTELGVRHVMRMFSKHFLQQPQTGGREGAPDSHNLQDKLPNVENVVCDEEVIEQAIRYSGVQRRA